jgi:plasmid stabilization system protein ParE
VTHAVLVLNGARDDGREIRPYVSDRFGANAWRDTDQKYRALLRDIGQFPHAGSVPVEATNLGLQDVRQRLLGPTRIIYQIDAAHVYIRLFVSVRRDFMAMLMERVLKSE